MKRFYLTALFCLISYLSAFSQIMLDSVLVVGTRATSHTPLTYSTLGKDIIKNSNLGAEVPGIMSLSPSLVLSSESGLGVGNTSFRIRGADPSRINISIDGVTINDPESQTVFWANMPDFGSSTGSIQIQRGVGVSTAGTASFGSSVNMITARPKGEAYGEVSAEYGSYNTMRYSIATGTGLINNLFTVDARYSNVSSDGYIERATVDGQSVFATAAYHGNTSTVKLNLFYGNQHTGISWNGVPGYMLDINRRYNPAGKYVDNDGNTRFYDNETDNYRQTQVNLQYSQQLGKYWATNLRVFLTKGLGYYEEYKANKKLADYGIPNFIFGSETVKKTDLVRQKWLDNYYYGSAFSAVYSKQNVQLTLGADASRFDNDHYGKLQWLRVNQNVMKGYEWYRNNAVKDDVSGFARLSYQARPWLSLFGDAQYRYVHYTMEGPDDDLAPLDQSHTFNFFNPKVGLTMQPSKQHELYLSFATTGREPARNDFKDASKYGARTKPTAEHLYDAELGYHFKSSSIALSANLYYMYYEDQILATGKMNDVGYPVMENVPESYRTGVELAAGVSFCKQMKLEANLSLSRNKIKNYVNYTDLYDNSIDWNAMEQKKDYLGTVDIGFSPSVVSGAQLSYSPIEQLTIGLSGKYVGKQYHDNTMNANRQLDSYFVSNLQAQYNFSLGAAKLTVMACLNNIFDKQYISSAWVYRAAYADGSPEYVEDGFFPQAGRTVFGKIVISI